MRVSQKEKEKTHQRILDRAARLVRERGLAGTAVADVMGEAGLTIGGFYRHFPDKDALMEKALQLAFNEGVLTLEKHFAEHEPAAALKAYRDYYLSKGHLENPGIGCPMPALASEVGRGSPDLRTAFGAGVKRMIDELTRGMEGPADQRRERAARELAKLVGALVIARASDRQTADEVLSACRMSSDDNVA